MKISSSIISANLDKEDIKIKKFIGEFEKFVLRSNGIDLAIGIVLSAAFVAIINSLVKNVAMQIIGALLGGVDFTQLKIVLNSKVTTDAAGQSVVQEAAIYYGSFIQSILDFLIIAFCVFLIVKLINKLRDREKARTEQAAVNIKTNPKK